MLTDLIHAFGDINNACRYLCSGHCTAFHTALALLFTTLLANDYIIMFQGTPLQAAKLAHVRVTKSYKRQIFAFTPTNSYSTESLESWPAERWGDANGPRHCVLRLFFRLGELQVDVDYTAAQYQYTLRSPLIPPLDKQQRGLPIVVSSPTYYDDAKAELQTPLSSLQALATSCSVTCAATVVIFGALLEPHKIEPPSDVMTIAASAL